MDSTAAQPAAAQGRVAEPSHALLAELEALQAANATLARLLLEARQADVQLERARRQLDLTENVSRTGSMSVTLPAGQLECSDQLRALYGIAPHARVTPRDLLRQVAREDRPSLFAALHEMTVSGFAMAHDIQVRPLRRPGTPAGEPLSLQVVGTLERREDGSPARLTLICRDVSERRDVVRQLTRSETLRQRLFDASPDGLLVARKRDGTIIDVNARFLETTGFQRDEVIGRTDAELGLWSDPNVRGATYSAVESGADIGNLEARFRLPDGRTVEALIALRVIEADGEQLVVVTVRNVTDYKNTLRALAESESRFALAFKEAPLPAFIVRRQDGLVIDANEAFFGAMGRRGLRAPTTQLAEAVRREDRAAFLGACTEPCDHVPLRLHPAHGGGFSAIVSSRHMRFRGEQCCIVFMQDMSAGEAAEQRFAQAIDINPDGALMINLANDAIVRVNRAFAEMSGHDAASMVGHSSLELGLWRDPAQLREFRSQVMTGPVRAYAADMRCADGRIIPVVLSASRSEIGESAWLLVNVHDTSRETEAARSLRASQERFERLFRTAPLAIALYRLRDQVLIDVNPEWEAMFGASALQLRERQADLREDFCNPSEYEDFARRMRESSEVRDFEAMLRRQGTPFNALLSARALQLDDEPHVLFYIANVDDLKNMEAQLRHAQKLEAIGQLAGGVAHDFNNLLSGIQGFTELILLDDGIAEASRGHARQVLSTVQRAAQLTKQLLIFSRRNPPRLAPVEMHDVIHNTVAILERSVDRRVQIVRHLAAADAMVLGDQSQIENALLNLCINARDAMQDGGVLTITTGVVQLGADTIRQHGMAIEPGTYLRLSVQDTGAGIAPDVRNRIFEPFFTTKAAGKGTGLGLAAVWGMVRAHNAGVQVDTAPGQGTSFHLYFRPHVGQDAGPKAEPAQQLVMGHGHILVVDDEANLRELVGTMLGALGYEVTLAEDGVHALEVFRQAPGRFDLVLLDMTMPRMNGHDTFAALRQVRADVRVLLTSGYVESSDLDSALALGATGVLNKPFDLSELSREVDASLARRRRVKR